MIDYTHDLHTGYCQHSHCQQAWYLSIPNPSKHLPPPPLLLPIRLPPGRERRHPGATWGKQQGASHPLQWLFTQNLAPQKPRRASKASRTFEEGSKWPHCKCVFSQTSTSSLVKTSMSSLSSLFFCIYKNCCRIILIRPQFYFSGERAKYTQRILWRNLLLSYLEDGHFNLFNLVILTHTNFRHNS